MEEQTLTKREVEILEQLVLDRSPEEIASFLNMDVAQVEKYLKLLMTEVRNRIAGFAETYCKTHSFPAVALNGET